MMLQNYMLNLSNLAQVWQLSPKRLMCYTCQIWLRYYWVTGDLINHKHGENSGMEKIGLVTPTIGWDIMRCWHDDVIKWIHFFRVTGHLWGESTGHRWLPLTKASDAELWCFLWSAPEPTVEQKKETLEIWDAIALIMTSLLWNN